MLPSPRLSFSVGRIALAIAAAGLLAVPASAFGAGGVPDPTFGGNGVASVNASAPEAREAGNAMVVDAQDRVLVGGGVLAKPPGEPNGGWVLARFRSDGTPDPTFGVDGVSREAPGLFGPGLAEFGQDIRALAIEPGTGKILAGGMTVTSTVPHYSLFTIARYDTDGALDMSFGPADSGFVTVGVTGTGADLKDIAVAPNGSITAVGDSSLDVVLARWDSDGNLDPDFDGPAGTGNGAFTDHLAGTFDDLRDVDVEPSGSIRAVGVASFGGEGQWLVARYRPNGERETEFNGTGAMTIAFGSGGSSLGAGQALVGNILFVFGSIDVNPGGDTERDFGVTALNASTGAEIPGTTARVQIPGNQNLFHAAFQQAGGAQGPTTERFLLSGVGEVPGGGGAILAAMRRVAPGSPVLEADPEFGTGSDVAPAREPGNWADVTTDSRNRVVVGGELGLYETADLSAARYVDDIPAPARDTTPPVISNATMTPKAFRRKKGADFRYTLSETARVAIAIERRKRRKVRKRPIFVGVGALEREGATGANRNRFKGKVGRKRLRPGGYRAILVATDAAGNASKPALVTFRVLRPRHRRP